jgi:WD40 repeat protein
MIVVGRSWLRKSPVLDALVWGLAAISLSLALPVAAHAAFPGDNGRIAFQSNASGNFDIWWYNPNDTSDFLQLTESGAADTEPAWSADGKKIAFTSDRTGGDTDIYVMDSNGVTETPITNNSVPDFGPAWSNDGNFIAYVSTVGGNTDIYKVEIATGTTTRLTTNAASDSAPAWSPDGGKIAFQSSRASGVPPEIYKMNVAGETSGLQRLTTNGTQDSEPNWEATGKRILYTSSLAGTPDVWVMNADGTANQNLTPGASYTGIQAQPAGSPQSPGYFAFTSNLRIHVNSIGGPLTGQSNLEDAADWQPITSDQARPKAATPTRIALVPAYLECNGTSGNSTHRTIQQNGSPAQSCNPARPTSSYLTVGTPGANGFAANSVGWVQLRATGGDGNIDVNYTDVRCTTDTSGGCLTKLDDYVGDLSLQSTVRVTDLNSGGDGGATVADFSFRVGVPCSETVDPAVGATCTVSTTIDAVMGTDAIVTGERAIWNFESVKVYDGGNDGIGSTQSDNSLFAVHGLFFP